MVLIQNLKKLTQKNVFFDTYDTFMYDTFMIEKQMRKGWSFPAIKRYINIKNHLKIFMK